MIVKTFTVKKSVADFVPVANRSGRSRLTLVLPPPRFSGVPLRGKSVWSAGEEGKGGVEGRRSWERSARLILRNSSAWNTQYGFWSPRGRTRLKGRASARDTLDVYCHHVGSQSRTEPVFLLLPCPRVLEYSAKPAAVSDQRLASACPIHALLVFGFSVAV